MKTGQTGTKKEMSMTELVAAIRGGDQQAFAQLYELTSQEVYRTARAIMRDEDAALDIQQDTFVFAWSHMDQLSDPAKVRPWLRSIAVNRARTVLRKMSPVLFTELENDEGEGLPEQADLSPEASPELQLERKETAQLVSEILAELSDGQRAAVAMYYYEQMPAKEIAEALGVNVGTVKSHLARGKKKIEDAVCALEKKGVRLYGLSPVAFLVALMRQAEPAAGEGARRAAVKAVIAKASADTVAATAVPVAAKTFGQVLTGRLLAGAMAVALIGGGIWGGAKLLKNNQRDNPYQPTTVETNERLSGVETPEEIPETIETLPVVTEPALTEPVVTEPAETQPAATEPAVTEPSGTEPADPTEPSDATEPTEPEIDPSWPAGTCGENLSWYLKPDGLLVIQGSGAMTDYNWDSKAPWQDHCWSITAVSLPDGLTSIGALAFYDSNLTNVTIPQGVTSIGGQAFYSCYALTNVTIPQGVTEIPCDAFESCSSLTNVTIPDSVTSIEAGAFNDCSSLTNVTIPERVTYIGMGAFMNCDALTSITIPASVTEIEIMAFEQCNSLSAIYVAPDNPNYSSQDGVLFDKAKTDLIQYPCGRTDPSYTIPDTVTYIDNGAFRECRTLKSISVGSGMTSYIGTATFQWCSALSDIHVSPDNPTYSSQDGVLFNKEKTKLLVYPQAKPDLSYTIPDSVTEIDQQAFRDCSVLSSVTIPGSVTKIGMYAFDECSALTNVTICEGVKSISVGACSLCHALASVTIPASVEEIDDDAFGIANHQDDLTVYGYAGTAAERYANENGAHFVDLAQ